MSTKMSLREESLDLLFNEFVNTYFTHSPVMRELMLQPDKSSPTQKSGTRAKSPSSFTENLSLRELLAASATARLYEATHHLLRSMLKETANDSTTKKSKSAQATGDTNIHFTLNLLRSHWKLSRLYVFKMEETKSGNQNIVPVYLYPAKTNHKSLEVNSSFVSQLKKNQNQHEIGESIKHFFNIVTPRLEFLPNAGEESLLVFYEHPMIPLVSTDLVNRLLNEVLLTHAHYYSLPANVSNTKSAQATKKSSAVNISTDKIYLYQRVVSHLLSLTGDSLTEVEEAIQFLFQIGGLTQAVITDNKNTLIAVYSAIKPNYNTLKSGKQVPEALLKEYEVAETENRARTIAGSKKNKTKSNKKALSANTHLLKLFTKKALHPQKKSPDLPFNHYAEILERLLVKRAMIKS